MSTTEQGKNVGGGEVGGGEVGGVQTRDERLVATLRQWQMGILDLEGLWVKLERYGVYVTTECARAVEEGRE